MFYDNKKKISRIPKQEALKPHLQDRRFLPRWEVRNRVLFRLEDDIFESECFSKDINAVGVCIYTKDKISLGQKFSLTIYLSGGIPPVRAIGTVKWCRFLDDHNFAGIHFDEIRSKSQDIIFKYAFEHKREELQRMWFQGMDAPHLI